MELVKGFQITYDAHNALLEKCDLAEGHLSVVLYSLRGVLQETDGDTGIYKALEAVATTAEDNFIELQRMIKALRP